MIVTISGSILPLAGISLHCTASEGLEHGGDSEFDHG